MTLSDMRGVLLESNKRDLANQNLNDAFSLQ